jgi:hypothetical protein
LSQRISGKHTATILGSVSREAFDGIERFNVRKHVNFGLSFRRLLAERQGQYLKYEFPSAFTGGDCPDPNLFSFSAGLFFTASENFNKCVDEEEQSHLNLRTTC